VLHFLTMKLIAAYTDTSQDLSLTGGYLRGLLALALAVALLGSLICDGARA